MYATWITGDPALNAATGCNTTQLSPYYAVYVAYSDHADSSSPAWKIVSVYQGPKTEARCAEKGSGIGTCDDDAHLFPHLAVDNGGNAYVTWVGYISSLDPHYDVYLSSSRDGGDTWSQSPHRVDNLGGYKVMPAIVAGDAGRVAIAWMGTSFDSQPYETGDMCPTNVPPQHTCAGKPKPQSPDSPWYVYVAQSVNGASGRPRFNTVRVSDAVGHYGDYCTLGIYCDSSSTGNRSLLDAMTIFTDAGGYLQVGWTDQREDPNGLADAADPKAGQKQGAFDQIYTACQTGGPSLFAHPKKPSSCTAGPHVMYKRGSHRKGKKTSTPSALLLLAGAAFPVRRRSHCGSDDSEHVAGRIGKVRDGVATVDLHRFG